MSTTPVRPSLEPTIDEETRRIIEERLLKADDEPRIDLLKALEERLGNPNARSAK